jgi:regulator of sigma E protease
MLDTLWKVGAIVLLLGGLVFVHELGHFIVAKLFGVKVLKFSLGFGPKIFGFVKGETAYQVAALPLGGFVRMAGESPDDDVSPEDQSRTFLAQAPWKRSLIALAGPGMNLLFPLFAYFAVFMIQHQTYSTRVGDVDPDLPAGRAGIRAGDRLTSIDGVPVKYFRDVPPLIEPRYDQPVKITFERGGQLHEVTVTPMRDEWQDILDKKVGGKVGIGAEGPSSVIAVTDPQSPAAKAGLRTFDRIVRVAGAETGDYVSLESLIQKQTGPFELIAVRTVDLGVPAAALSKYEVIRTTVSPEFTTAEGGNRVASIGVESEEPYIFNVKSGSAAEKAGLRRGDRLVAVDGAPITGWMSFGRRLKALAPNGGGFQLTLKRDGQLIQTKVQLQKETWTDQFERQVTEYTFGAEPDLRDVSRSPAELIPITVGAAVKWSGLETADWIKKTVQVLVGLVQRKISMQTVGGPIMLMDIAIRAAQAGSEQYLQAMAIISVSLGMMNIIPIPVLDGFHVMAALFEMIRRRPLPTRVREIATYIGLGLLATLMIVVFRNDFLRYFVSK